ncbi:MAG: histidinol dehydrogenase, partial [Acidimicrobiales bacterium]|nr:histidinol dehydrogenase [Acidimicrobiales bacterium]
AIDVVAQAEHGPDGLAWLVTWDEAVADAVEAEGMACVVTDTIMSSPDVAALLAKRILGMPAEDLTPDASVTPTAGASRNAEARR